MSQQAAETDGSSAPAPGRTLRVLHVGVAHRGRWPLDRCKGANGFKSVAMCDVSEQALAQAREWTGLGEADCYTDLSRALAQSGADCVIICTPTIYHVPMAKQCIAAGLPVLTEKGMAPDWHTAQELVRVTQQARAIVAVAQNYRYMGIFHALHRALSDPSYQGYVGKAHFLSYSQYRVRPVPGGLTYPFASVWDMSCHHFDNMLYWLGPVRAMMAQSWGADWSAYEYANNTTAHIEFENDAHMHYFHGHDAARSSLEVQIHGQRGAIVFRDGLLEFNERPLEQFGHRDVVKLEYGQEDAESGVLRDFYNYITQGKEPGISARNNLETMAMCEMMVRSITQGRRVLRSDLNGVS